MTKGNPIKSLTECKHKILTIELIETNRMELINKVIKMQCQISDYSNYGYGVFCFKYATQATVPDIQNMPAQILTNPGPFTGTANQQENHENHWANYQE